MSFADDIVVDNPLEFGDFFQRGFAVNFLAFESCYCFGFHQVWWDESHRGYLSPFSVVFGLSDFGWLIRVGIIIFYI